MQEQNSDPGTPAKTRNKKSRKPASNRKFLWIWTPILAITLVIIIGANVALNVFHNWVASQLGTGTWEVTNTEEAEDWDLEYNKAAYDSLEDAHGAASDLVEQIAADGITLLKNSDDALPITAGSVTLFGRTSAEPVYGGSGSGSVDASTAVDVRGGLEHAGFQINETVYEELTEFADDAPRTRIVMDEPDQSEYAVGEMPAGNYSDEAVDSFQEYNDAAIVVFGRGGGEGGDLATDMEGWDENYFEGQHELMLNVDEQDTLELAQDNFDTVVVIINSSNIMELGDLENDDDVDAILWTGAPGETGFNALGGILTGDISPSGRTVDLWASDFTADPSFANFGRWEYTNIDESNASTLQQPNHAAMENGAFFVELEEGIYNGYRFYETAAQEGFLDYEETVVYPFGYGLSYTTFEWDLVNATEPELDGIFQAEVEVTNTGGVPGSDVVQLYYTAPYTPGGVEKAYVELGDFAKTGLLEPGESETVTLELAVEDMASYDYQDAEAWVLDEGTYELKIQTDSHSLAEGIDPIDFDVAETAVFGQDTPRAGDEQAATNRFDEVSQHFSGDPDGEGAHLMSREDFGATFPTAPDEADQEAADYIIEGYQHYDAEAAAEASEAEMPTTGADNGLTLIDMRGLDYDDPQWAELLDQLEVDDMTDMLLNGAYNTEALPSIAKPRTDDIDGPHGFTSFINDDFKGAAYPSAPLIAATWNKDLVYQMGEMMGEEALQMGVSGWYAPGVNLHRSPFAGRNFEYFSEDPTISGVLGAEVVSGAASRGLYAYTKHFAMNDQENGRVDNGIATWADEQTMREIYLKPFEMIVKEASAPMTYIADDDGNHAETEIGSTAMMSSFNRIGATWAGGYPELLDDVLRDEWGFRGVVITDFNLYGFMSPDQSIAAGTDHQLVFAPMKSFEDTDSAEAVSNIRNATHNVLYTVANSNAMNGLGPDAEVSYTPAAWEIIRWVVTAVLGLLWVVGLVWVIRRVRNHQTSSDRAGA
ncbi:glycoside hydrolase family 3 N-terminal domain-containing protein [Nesterenkonia haasae]|uniref:glycoside hydrolase family 3 N-terminal domain-containing protein n=1 Tax=Nesterenkonia haasae TaxID=2587813 RepID=UPI001390BA94|nr:glycoside hydrolase family 3 N-terminal domain-containing protein [Nesterenkonia haasae]NDK32602.1 beta-glucosidase [Nesterenkonia haasae]